MSDAIDRTSHHLRLQRINQNTFKRMGFVLLIYSVIVCSKSAIFYFAFDLKCELAAIFNYDISVVSKVVSNYFLYPEFYSFHSDGLSNPECRQNSNLETVQVYFGILVNGALLVLIILVYLWFESDLFRSYSEGNEGDSMVHLYTIEVSRIKDLDESIGVLEFLALMVGSSDMIVSDSRVFDLEPIKTFQKKLTGSKLFETTVNKSVRDGRADASQSRIRSYNDKRQVLLGVISAPRALGSSGLSSFINMKIDQSETSEFDTGKSQFKEVIREVASNKFTGVMMVTFKDFSCVQELLKFYYSGELKSKARAMVDSGEGEYESLVPAQLELLRRAIEPGSGFVHRIKMAPSHGLQDIMWENYSLKKRMSEWKWFAIIALVGLGFVALLIFVQFWDVEETFKILDGTSTGFSVFGKTFTGLSLFFMILPTLISEAGQVFLDIVLGSMHSHYYSHKSNRQLYTKLTFEILFRFVAVQYGTYIFFEKYRAQLSEAQLISAFANYAADWYIKAIMLVVSTVWKYAFDFLKKLVAKWRVRGTKKQLEYTFDVTIAPTVVSITFLQLGFYNFGQSPLSLTILTFNLLLNWLLELWSKTDRSVLKSHLSYSNISVLILFTFLIFLGGGVLSLFMHYYFTPLVFFSTQGRVVFPYFFYFALVGFLVFLPFFAKINNHNSVVMRLIAFLLAEHAALEVALAADAKDFRSENPFYKEAVKLNIDIDHL